MLYNSKIVRAPFKNYRLEELGNTNSIIRRDLWEKHNFDESLINGSEDYEWSKYWKIKGYKIIRDPKFAVYHSHHLSFKGVFDQQRKWNSARKEIDKSFKILLTSI